MSEVLKVTGLEKSYGKTKILKGIDLSIKKGDVYGFLGPNGAGKTTTIRSILGLIKKDKGKVYLNGYDADKYFKKAINKVGSVVETPRFYEHLSGYKNLKLMANLYDNVPKKRIYEVLELTGMFNRMHDKVSKYSLGMKQRLGIARALLNNPELILLDEPTNGLDPSGMKEVRELIIRLAQEEKITFMISSHLLHEVEMMCNRVGIIKNGEKIVEGEVEELINDSKEKVEIHTKNASKVLELMNEHEHFDIVDHQGHIIILESEKGKSKDLNKLLVERNIIVDYIIPKKNDLENIFINLTGGGDQIA